jgi:EAL domain-containing protein (putative c-di-GMP-specific phosphodiesterase class I)
MQTISRALADNRLDPALLELELTETLIMSDAEGAARKLWAFHETGLRIAVDDFGTGYSSMNYLKRFPLDTLKIDRSFVCDLVSDSTDAAIVRAIIALGQALDITTLAEGVETQEQFNILARSGCDQIQGFLTGRPAPADKIYSRAKQTADSKQPFDEKHSTTTG